MDIGKGDCLSPELHNKNIYILNQVPESVFLLARYLGGFHTTTNHEKLKNKQAKKYKTKQNKNKQTNKKQYCTMKLIISQCFVII